MRLILAVFAIIYFNTSYCQNLKYPNIKSTAKKITDFIPNGWTMLDSAFGDLNKDGFIDAAIIIQHKDSVLMISNSADTIWTQSRILLIFFKLPKENMFRLVEKSNTFILKNDNDVMDDPYNKLKIINGSLEIKFHLFYFMGSYSVINSDYKFRYQHRQFELIGADCSEFSRSTHDFEDRTYNFLSKKRSVSVGNESTGLQKKTWRSFKILKLKTFETFKEPFTWEVEKDFYL